MSTRVLIIDDSLTVRMDLVEAFGAAGFEVGQAASAEQARAVLAAGGPFDVIVLDRQLPDADGLAFLLELRAAPGGAGTVIIMLSSRAEVAHRLEGMRDGADEYVGKPYDIGFLVATAHQLVRARRPEPTRPRTVLVIDDSLTFREGLRQAIEDGGYAVLVASSGEEGLQVAARERPDLIIVDGLLPGIDGPTVIRHVRLDAALRQVPCMLLTGSGVLRAEVTALDAGADAFAGKEEPMAVILAKLANLLRPGIAHEAQHAPLRGPKRVLAVDDSMTYLQELSEQLRSEGYDVVSARGGDEALSLIAVQTIDCVLLDLIMPGLSGEETCSRIKAAPVLREIPVIILTSREDAEGLIACLSVGADDYIPKSTDMEILKARVRVQIRRRQAEDEKRRTRDHVQQREVAAVEMRSAHDLAAARAVLIEELQRKNQDLEAFSYSVSHDLMAPLRVIGGYARVLIEDHAAILPEDARTLLNDIDHNALRMTELIGDLLRLARIGLQPVSLQEVDIGALVRSVADELQGTDPGHVLELRIADLPPCLGDVALLRQVFLNLVSNARKFTRRATHPWLAVTAPSAPPQTPPQVRYQFTDNGVGFPPQHAHRLFRAFKRLHRAEDFEGTGIGLSIVQRIIQRHGGTIEASSAAGAGATFLLSLPAFVPTVVADAAQTAG